MEEKSELILPWLPEKLENVHKSEEQIRIRSILQINATSDLRAHMGVVYKALNLIHLLSFSYENKTENELTLQYLGGRLFNSILSSTKLLLAGYYQGAVIFQRDILEVGYLLDYFLVNPEDISDWKKASTEDRFRKYRPKKIRNALDRRDGFADHKRAKKYQIMCEYGAHATYPGFKMVAPKKLINIGPFLDLNYLKFVLEELSNNVPLFCYVFSCHFNSLPPELERERSDFISAAREWAQLFLKINWEDDKFDLIKIWIVSITRS